MPSYSAISLLKTFYLKKKKKKRDSYTFIQTSRGGCVQTLSEGHFIYNLGHLEKNICIDLSVTFI